MSTQSPPSRPEPPRYSTYIEKAHQYLKERGEDERAESISAMVDWSDWAVTRLEELEGELARARGARALAFDDLQYAVARIEKLDRLLAQVYAQRDGARDLVAALKRQLADAPAAAIRDLVGDPHADEPNGVLDRYQIRAIDLQGQPVVIWHCPLPHEGNDEGCVGVIARDMDFAQTNLTLAEIVHAVIEHQDEEHVTPTPEES